MYKLLPILLALMLVGCDLVLPTEPVDEEEFCELFRTVTVVRSLNSYWSEELDILQDRLGLDCILTDIEERWIQIDHGVLWLFTYETWKCYTCSEGQVVPPNA